MKKTKLPKYKEQKIGDLTFENLEKLYNKILYIYPFLSKAEQKRFERESKKIINNESSFKKNPLGTTSKLFKNLNNPHADVREQHKQNLKLRSRSKIRLSPTFDIKDRILYIKIPSWVMLLGDIDKKLISFCHKNIKKYDSLIIDVRDNEGGNSRVAHNFAGIFFKKNVTFGTLVAKYKGKLKKEPYVLKKHKKIYIDKPIIIIINNKCFSSNELFIAPFKISKRAVLVGERTRGGSANPLAINFEVAGKDYKARIPRWRFYLKGKKDPIEKTGIEPDKDISKFVREGLLSK